jgi:hypothetical protein
VLALPLDFLLPTVATPHLNWTTPEAFELLTAMRWVVFHWVLRVWLSRNARRHPQGMGSEEHAAQSQDDMSACSSCSSLGNRYGTTLAVFSGSFCVAQGRKGTPDG